MIDDLKSEALLKSWRERAWAALREAKEGAEATLKLLGSWPAPPDPRKEWEDPPDPNALQPGWSWWTSKRRQKGGP